MQKSLFELSAFTGGGDVKPSFTSTHVIARTLVKLGLFFSNHCKGSLNLFTLLNSIAVTFNDFVCLPFYNYILIGCFFFLMGWKRVEINKLDQFSMDPGEARSLFFCIFPPNLIEVKNFFCFFWGGGGRRICAP